MGRACTRWGSAKCMQNTRRKTAGKVVLGYVGMNGSVVLICAFSKEECKNGYWTGMD